MCCTPILCPSACCPPPTYNTCMLRGYSKVTQRLLFNLQVYTNAQLSNLVINLEMAGVIKIFLPYLSILAGQIYTSDPFPFIRNTFKHHIHFHNQSPNHSYQCKVQVSRQTISLPPSHPTHRLG